MTHVFVAPIADIKNPSALARAQAAKYRNADMYRQSLAAWSLLEQALQKEGVALGANDIVISEHGKPLHREGLIEFSLSHAHELAAVTISTRPVGVDIELAEPHPKYQLEMDLAEFCRREADLKRRAGFLDEIKRPPQIPVFLQTIRHAGQAYYLAVACETPDALNVTVTSVTD